MTNPENSGGDNDRFEEITANLVEEMAILDMPTPPWMLAAEHKQAGLTPEESVSFDNIVSGMSAIYGARVTSEMREEARVMCRELIAVAREKDSLFMDTLERLRFDVGEAHGGASGRVGNPDEVGLLAAAAIVADEPNPAKTEEFMLRWEEPAAREREDAINRRTLENILSGRTSGPDYPKEFIDQFVSSIRDSLDPVKRMASYKHVLSVVYGDRWTAYQALKNR